MPRPERRSDRADSWLARAEGQARKARERCLREGNAGRPAAGARHARTGLPRRIMLWPPVCWGAWRSGSPS
jgi:hypothetical protein